MATENNPDDSPQDTDIALNDIDDGETDADDDLPAPPVVAPAAPYPPVAAAPDPAQTATHAGSVAELSAQLRDATAEIAEIAAQAGSLGIVIDAAKALREGTAPEALRRLVLERARPLRMPAISLPLRPRRSCRWRTKARSLPPRNAQPHRATEPDTGSLFQATFTSSI